MNTPRVKRLLFVFIALVIVVGAAEAFSLMVGRLNVGLFRPDAGHIRSLADPEEYAVWLRDWYDAELGWTNLRSRDFHGPNCAGVEVSCTYDENGARGSHGSEEIDVIAVGDSYTRGDEVNDEETYPVRIHRLSGLVVANYGVGATGPLQQVMYFERLADFHPEFHIGTLGIMYENLRRLPNRLQFFQHEDVPFYFRPYLDVTAEEPVPRPNPNAPPAPTVEELLPLVEDALRQDYYLQTPALSFPYTVSVVKLFGSRRFIYGFLNRWNLLTGREVLGWFDDEKLVEGLEYVVSRFSSAAEQHGAVAVVFIPNGGGRHLQSPDAFIQRYESKWPDQVFFIDVGDADIDWSRYSVLDPGGTPCHPSVYGQEMIGRFIVGKLRGAGLI